MMTSETPAVRYLQQQNIPHRVFVHSGPIRSLEQAAEERGQQPGQVVRSILFRLSDNEFVMALMAGPRQISWKALRRYLGKSRLTMAKDEEVLAVTGFQPGAVSPFGLPTPLRMLVDTSVKEQEEVSIGSGVRGTTIILRTVDLLRVLPAAEIDNFGED
jgi:Cys-tRNA(Pro)/Cys-tRNA(Cys) deacylase